MEARFFTVQSFSNPNKRYVVRQTSDGEWRCDCPFFVFRNKKCDHIRKIRHTKMKYHGRKLQLDKKG